MSFPSGDRRPAGRIREADIAAVRDAARIADIIGEHVTLKSAGGGNLKGLCPFHDERSPSFSVSPSKNAWHCLAGETGVITRYGTVPIRDLAGKTVEILDGKGRWVTAPFKSYGVQPLLELVLSRNGRTKTVFATAEHRWFVVSGRNRQAHREETTVSLKPGDALVPRFTHATVKHRQSAISPFGIARGVVFGDGHLSPSGAIAQLVGEKDAQLTKYFINCHRWDGDGYSQFYGIPKYYKTDRPDLDESREYLLGWLAGYFAADGCVADDGDVTLASADRKNLEYAEALCTRIGVRTFGISTQNRLGIDGKNSDIHTLRFIASSLPPDFFLLSQHRERFEAGVARRKYERTRWIVQSVRPTRRVEEVFCAEVPTTHSFVIEGNILTGNCFGCGEGGDTIGFVQKIEHTTFVEAVERLAERYRIELRYEDGPRPGGSVPAGQRARLVSVNKATLEFYRARFTTPEAETGRKFLTDRGFTIDDANQFEVGFAPSGWDHLTRHLRGKGFSDEDMIAAGVAVKREDRPGVYDRFRGRLIWPIRDLPGDVIGFGARKLFDEDQGPKYLNTPETVLYKKSEVLYGVHAARKKIAATKTAVIVEGYTDVMAAHLSGVETAVATCGTAFGEGHVKVLRRLLLDSDMLNGRVVFTFDGDKAGQAAAVKAFNTNGRFVAATYVAIAPDGMDPCELRFQRGPESVKALVDSAVPLVEFVLRTTIAEFDLDTVEGRTNAMRAAAPLIAGLADPTLAASYTTRLAGWVGMPDHLVRDAVNRIARQRRNAGSSPVEEPATESAPEPEDDPFGDRDTAAASTGSGWQRPNPNDPVLLVEREALKCMLAAPALTVGWPDSAEDSSFTHPGYRAVWQAVSTHPWVDGDTPAGYLTRLTEATTDPLTRALLTELSVEPALTSMVDEEYVRGCLVRLLEQAAAREIANVKAQIARLAVSDPGYAEAFARLLALEDYRRGVQAWAAG